jgi:hypothetical protein
MDLKTDMKKYPIIIPALVIAIILVSGCTAPANNTTTQTAGAAGQSHDAFLEKYVNETYRFFSSQSDQDLWAWDVTWHNATTVNVIFVLQNKTAEYADSNNRTIIHFNSTSDATAYFNNLNRTGYVLAATFYSDGPYQNTVGHKPAVYKMYEKDIGTKIYTITLMDDVVFIDEITQISGNE